MTAGPVVVFDVNETLSDMAPMAARFERVGAPGLLAGTWFASVLRDGFALAASGGQEPFARIAEQNLRTLLAPIAAGGSGASGSGSSSAASGAGNRASEGLDRPLDDAVAHVLEGFSLLAVHDDVPEGIAILRDAGLRLVTLTNGATSVAERLLGAAGLLDAFEHLLSVEDAGVWKPASAAYEYAARTCGVDVADLLLIAVHPWDIAGAVRAGARAGWVNRSGSDYPGHFTRPTFTAASLPDLAGVVVAA